MKKKDHFKLVGHGVATLIFPVVFGWTEEKVYQFIIDHHLLIMDE